MYILDFDAFSDEKYFRISDFDSSIIFIYAHCLPSFVDLISYLIHEIGFLPRNIFILPKIYSKIPEAEKALSNLGVCVIDSEFDFIIGEYDDAASKKIRKSCKTVKQFCDNISRSKKCRLILVDDGGLLTKYWHKDFGEDNTFEVVSIQQTTSGINEEPRVSKIPKINVARSAAKRWFESDIIAAGVVRRVSNLNILSKEKTFGVCGYGAVGKALANKLSSDGYKVIIHDIAGLPKTSIKKNIRIEKREKEFLLDADVILGCVGRNWITKDLFFNSYTAKEFISCSSRDIEFRNVLKVGHWGAESGQHFSNLFTHECGGKTIYNGGFPINFDRTIEYEEFNEIVITRSLILGSILQAMCIEVGETYKRPLKLSVNIQKKIVEKWLENNDEINLISKYGVKENEFRNLDWWAGESSGDDYHLVNK